jgi:hypothetical protein
VVAQRARMRRATPATGIQRMTVRPRITTEPTWRLGKKVLGATVPMRFHAGEPPTPASAGR